MFSVLQVLYVCRAIVVATVLQQSVLIALQCFASFWALGNVGSIRNDCVSMDGSLC